MSTGDDADERSEEDERRADDGRAPDAEASGGERPTGADLEDENGAAEAPLLVAERQTEEGLLVAVCDRDVLGETFREGEITLTVTEEFYGGDAADEAAVVDSLARATVANIVGAEAVSLAVEEGFVDEANVLEVGETLHAQLLWM